MKKGLIFVFLFLSHWVFAKHIVGGELTYKYISKASNNDVTYAVKLVLYLDCKDGIDAIKTDATVFFNVFDAKTGGLLKNLCREVSRQNPLRISTNPYKCIKNLPDVCVDMYVYEINMVLPRLTNGYIISFERCCRNNIISNINNPENTGATFWTEIKPEVSIGKNSSPVFKARPPIFLCINAPFVFDHSATDADGDSLVYELYTPYLGAGTTNPRPAFNNPVDGTPVFPLNSNRLVKWKNPYSLADEMGGNPILEVDELTGRLTVTPTQSGQFVMGIKVKEYRKGVLIGETKRDYQFNVANCVFDVVSVFSPVNPSTNIAAKTFCTSSPVLFKNLSNGALSYHWDFGEPGTNADTSNKISPTYSYSKSGTYKVTLIAKNLICIDTFDYIITVKQSFKTYLGKDTIFCNPTSFKLDAGNPGKQYLWNTGETTRSVTVGQTGNYIVTVTDAPCTAKDTISVIIDKSVLDAGKDSIQCNYAFVPFTYKGPTGYKSYLWNDGSTIPNIFIPKTGKYWLTIINQNNCLRTDTIRIFQSKPPTSDLTDTAVCIGHTARFDAKILNFTYQWNTGETSRYISPSIPGRYWVDITNGLCSSSDTAILSNIDPGVDIGNDTSFCGPFSFTVKTNKHFATYSWNNEINTPKIVVSQPGLVTLTIQSIEGCYQSDSLYIINYPQNISFISGDTMACTSSFVNLTASKNETYLWNTGETTATIITQRGGTFNVVITDTNDCADTAYHTLMRNPNTMPNEVYMANAFTPNGDMLNEHYPDNKYEDIQAPYDLKIFNRWGEKLFETQSPDESWSGLSKEKPCQAGVYIYVLNYIGCDNQRHLINGEFNLIR